MKIGILSIQGNYARHQQVFDALGVPSIFVRYPDQLNGIDGLVIPGGESTTMTILLRRSRMAEAIRKFSLTRPVFGTCAGLILMSSGVDDSRVEPLNLLPITVTRNSYGRQIFSFTDEIKFTLNGQSEAVQGTFIRAPKIESMGAGIEVLARYQDEPVAVRGGLHIGLAFHPEQDGIVLFHSLFIQSVKTALNSRKNTDAA